MPRHNNECVFEITVSDELADALEAVSVNGRRFVPEAKEREVVGPAALVRLLEDTIERWVERELRPGGKLDRLNLRSGS